MLLLASGAEEAHTFDGCGVSAWAAVNEVSTIDDTFVYTGDYALRFSDTPASGGGPSSVGAAGSWWSHAFYFNMWGDGTHYCLWQVKVDSPVRFVGFNIGTAPNEDTKAKIALYSAAAGTTLAESTTEFDFAEWHRFKWECVDGYWTFWGSDNGAAWEELFTYDDSGNFTTGTFDMDINASTDETKGAGYFDRVVDDVLFWDDTGDNWNSRITAMSDFPRVSVAHMPVDPDSTTPDQNDKIDEIPPDGVDEASVNDANYYTAAADLDETGSATRPDLTGEYIQAVMVTHVANSTPNAATLAKFNLYDGTDLYADSEEGGQAVQQGWRTDAAVSTSTTWAGYYPWTPDGATPANENWTEALFEAYSYGISLISGKTDQMTVQAIFFGSSHEWEPPAAPTGMRRRGGMV